MITDEERLNKARDKRWTKRSRTKRGRKALQAPNHAVQQSLLHGDVQLEKYVGREATYGFNIVNGRRGATIKIESGLPFINTHLRQHSIREWGGMPQDTREAFPWLL